MNKILVAVLTSGEPEKLERCLQSVNSNSSPHERVVVINTTNTDYTSLATEIAFEYGFPVHVSDSNGTPARGKNSVLEYFRKTDNDWVFQIDGDDYISDGCISRLQYEIEQNEFDAAVLTGSQILDPNGDQRQFAEGLSSDAVLQYAGKWTKEEHAIYLKFKKHLEQKTFDGDLLNRFLLMNRDITEHRFNETLAAAEDNLFFLQTADTFKFHPIDVKVDDFIYMYDQTTEGAFRRSLKDGKFLNDLRKINSATALSQLWKVS